MKAAGMGAVAIDCKIFSFKRLDYKIGNNPSVVRIHPGSVSIEDPGNLDTHFILVVVVHK